MNYYNEIKNLLINNEVNRKVKTYSINKSDLDTYYQMGKMLHDAGKHYGKDYIGTYSKKLMVEVDKKYNITTLKRIRQFYLLIQKGATLSHQLSWSHYIEIIPLNSLSVINYYIRQVELYNLSVRQLRQKIKNEEYERLPKKTKLKLANSKEENIVDYVKNPIIINNPNNYADISEKVLQRLILEDISSFLKELGDGFTFIDNEYKIKIGNTYNYIDLLLFNYLYNCFVVIELKVNELKKQDIGQIEIYMNYIDKNVKRISHDKTIGIIICKEDNKYIIEYSSDKRIIARKYILL